MGIRDITTWKILDTEFDVEFSHDINEFEDNFEKVDEIKSKLIIFDGGRKVSQLVRSILRVSLEVIVYDLKISPLHTLSKVDLDVVLDQFALSFNCLMRDNEWKLNQDKWKIIDSEFKLIWCEHLDQLSKEDILLGLTDFVTGVIYIYRDGRQESELWQTLLHETLHVIIKKMPIVILEKLDHTEEQECIIDQISVGLNRIIQDNPIIIEK